VSVSALWTDMSIEELEQRMEFGVIGPFSEPCGQCDTECGADCGTQCGCYRFTCECNVNICTIDIFAE